MDGKVKALILNFNNYYNKILKIRTTKDEYLEYGYEYAQFIDFNPNDGVNTSHKFNITIGTTSPDYIVILDEQDNIISRWFVIEQTRTRGGQYKLDLRRDVIADYYDAFKNSKAFVERGWLKQSFMASTQGSYVEANTLIFNQENVAFNKIKKNQWLLYNNNKCPWIMIYLARTDGTGKGMTYEGQFDFDYIPVVDPGINLNYSFNYLDSTTQSHSDPVTIDAEFEVIAIPYCDKLIKFKSSRTNGDLTVNQNKLLVYQWAANIASKYSKTGLYDVQLVPYCPINPENYDFTNEVDQNNLPIKAIELLKATKDETVAVGFKLYKSKFTQIVGNDDISSDFDDLKLSNSLEQFRITSPNGVGNFDYSVAKNGFLKVNKFEADVTLKPINPYIKINPVINTYFGLYGNDYNDYRGLICSGNFSLSVLSNEWLTYELNNKNYQTMFNREIDTIDKLNDFSLIRDLFSGIGGTIGGGASAAVGGAMVGGVPGAIVGGTLGGAASVTGGAADILINVRERELQRNLKVDLYQMSHENVKARAVGMTRSSIFDINNKIFPYVERYCCSAEEITYFKNYIDLKSYNIGVISKPIDFIEPGKFIQGSIIDIDIQEDYHLVDEINNYFEVGFRIEEQRS